MMNSKLLLLFYGFVINVVVIDSFIIKSSSSFKQQQRYQPTYHILTSSTSRRSDSTDRSDVESSFHLWGGRNNNGTNDNNNINNNYNDPNDASININSRRRDLLRSVASTTTLIATTSYTTNSVANAVMPITPKEADGMVQTKLLRILRPKPPILLRSKIQLPFAILLMRTSYAITDELNFIPMNQFQRDFFIIRSSEYEYYNKYITDNGSNIRVVQGDLSDPYYFDFISFVQYLTVNRAITNNPLMIFNELQPKQDQEQPQIGDIVRDDDANDTPYQRFENVIVRRTVPDDRLVYEHDKRVGDGILQYFDETFGSNPSTALPTNTGIRVSMDVIEKGLTQLMKLFLINGYGWDGKVEKLNSSSSNNAPTKFCITISSPANLWGGQSLQFQRCPLCNDYVLKTCKAFIRRMDGYTIVTSSVKYDGYNEQNYITIL